MSSAETINILATFLYLFVSEDIEGIILHYNPVVSEKLNGTVSAAFVFFFNKHHLLHNGPKLWMLSAMKMGNVIFVTLFVGLAFDICVEAGVIMQLPQISFITLVTDIHKYEKERNTARWRFIFSNINSTKQLRLRDFHKLKILQLIQKSWFLYWRDFSKRERKYSKGLSCNFCC